jgi:hypothetical protein
MTKQVGTSRETAQQQTRHEQIGCFGNLSNGHVDHRSKSRLHKRSQNVLLSLQIVTVNCARLVKTDQHATNGIVHVVDRVITAVTNDVHTFIDTDDDLETLRVSKQLCRVIHSFIHPFIQSITLELSYHVLHVEHMLCNVVSAIGMLRSLIIDSVSVLCIVCAI